jgi:transcription-repair coupling factor (superfamily II helicase)
VLFLAPDAKSADALLEDLRVMLGEAAPEAGGQVRPFPHPDTLPYDRFSPQPFVTTQRMDVLYRWLEAADGRGAADKGLVVVAPLTALALRVPAREALRARTTQLNVGQWVDRDVLVAELVAAGYARMALVEERGEVAVRGGIVEVFPPQRTHPAHRTDRRRSSRSATSTRRASALAAAGSVTPAAAPDQPTMICDRAQRRDPQARRGRAPTRAPPTRRSMRCCVGAAAGSEALAPWINPASRRSSVPAGGRAVVSRSEAAHGRLARFGEETLQSLASAHAAGRVVAPPDELLLSADALERALASRMPVSLERLDIETDDPGERIALRSSDHDELRRELARSRTGDAALLPLIQAIERWGRERWRVVLATPSLSGAERLRQLLLEYGHDARLARDAREIAQWGRPGRWRCASRRSPGFTLPLARTVVDRRFSDRASVRRAPGVDAEGGGARVARAAEDQRSLVHASTASIYRAVQLSPSAGDAATTTSSCASSTTGDRLFVPVHRLSLVQRYVGAEGVPPRIDKLGGLTWEKAKRHAKKSLRDMARELLGIHAARELAEGFSFSPRDRALENSRAPSVRGRRSAGREDVLADI